MDQLGEGDRGIRARDGDGSGQARVVVAQELVDIEGGYDHGFDSTEQGALLLREQGGYRSESKANVRVVRPGVDPVIADCAGVGSGIRRTIDQKAGGEVQVASQPGIDTHGCCAADSDTRVPLTGDQRDVLRLGTCQQLPEQRAVKIIQVQPVGFLARVHLTGRAMQGGELREPALLLGREVETVGLVAE